MSILLATLFSSATIVFASVLPSRDVDVAPSVITKRSILTDTSYLPAQIGGLLGAYAASLVIVALLLILFSKRRRDHLESGDDLEFIQENNFNLPIPETLQFQDSVVPFASKTPVNFSFPQNPADKQQPYIVPRLTTTFCAPGVDLSVDQEVVSADREMAQAQLEEMYKYVLEQEEAKAAGVVLQDPPPAVSPVSHSRQNSTTLLSATSTNASSTGLLRKKSSKAMNLSLNLGKEEKKESRASALLSALKSPRRKKMQGISISSPIMTPMSGTFPRGTTDGEEMNAIPPRFYAPAAPPPVPPILSAPPKPGNKDKASKAKATDETSETAAAAGLPTPDVSPLSTQSIDQRIGATIVTTNLPPARPGQLAGTSPADPDSATSHVSHASHASRASHTSTAPLVGLPTSPKPGVNRFPTLPSSPRASTFSPASLGSAASPTSFRSNAPSAVRTGGALPLRAYEPSLASPSFAAQTQTKQTVFERTMPQSPGAAPWTGVPVPYSPYQPFSPVVPMTPSLVTKADRKRMRRLEPKTPTMEMVRSIDDIW